MNFKKWLISEELYPNNTAVVYHRTNNQQKILGILSSGFQAGEGSRYGKGLYTTFALESQFTDYMARYGNFLVKFKVTDLDKYLICQLSVAKYILGKDYSISSQFKKFNIQATEKDLKEYDHIQEKIVYSSDLARQIYTNNKIITSKCKGIIFRGQNDGYVLVKYEPVNDSTISMLGYAHAEIEEFDKMQKLLNNQDWETSTFHASIKSISKVSDEEKKKSLVGNLSVFNDFLKNKKYLQMFKFINYLTDKEFVEYVVAVVNDGKIQLAKKIIKEKGEKINDQIVYMILSKAVYFEKNLIQYKEILERKNINKIHPESAISLFGQIPIFGNSVSQLKLTLAEILGEDIISNISGTSSSYLITDDKTKFVMANIFLKYKKELDTTNIRNIMSSVKDKDWFAIQIINKESNLNHYSVREILLNVENKKHITNILGKQNISKLVSDDVEYLLDMSNDVLEMANCLGEDNIGKLSDHQVRGLLATGISTDNLEEMTNVILTFKKELTNENIRDLLTLGYDKEKIEKTIIENKPDLTHVDVYHLLAKTNNLINMANLLGEKNINKLYVGEILSFFDKKSEINLKNLAKILKTYYKTDHPELKSIIDRYYSES